MLRVRVAWAVLLRSPTALGDRPGWRARRTLQGYPAPFDAAIPEIKINLALGGRPGPLAEGALAGSGATFEVDYIRAVVL